jgi:hypothetical protein
MAFSYNYNQEVSWSKATASIRYLLGRCDWVWVWYTPLKPAMCSSALGNLLKCGAWVATERKQVEGIQTEAIGCRVWDRSNLENRLSSGFPGSDFVYKWY